MIKLINTLKVSSIAITILVTGIAIYGNYYGWSAAIVTYHGESENYFPPITIFEMWKDGNLSHRSFLMFPRKLYPPKLVMLTSVGPDSKILESYLAFWIVLLAYIFGWYVLALSICDRVTNFRNKH